MDKKIIAVVTGVVSAIGVAWAGVEPILSFFKPTESAPVQDNRTINNSDIINNTGGTEQNVNISKPVQF